MTSNGASQQQGNDQAVLPAQRTEDRWPQPETPEEQHERQQAAQDNRAARGAARRPQAKHRIRSRREKEGRRAGMPVKPISVSVPSSVASAWRGHSQRMKRSLVDVLLDAIPLTVSGGEKVLDKARAAEMVRTHQSATRLGRQVVSDGVFLRSLDSIPAEDRDGADIPADDPYVTVPLRMLSTNVDILDALAYETAAESRSQLVVAVLNAHLADSQAEFEARTAHQAEQAEQEMLPIS